MNNGFMFKLAQIRSSYTRKRFGTINNEEKALIDYETFCLELIKDYEKLEQENNQLKEEYYKQIEEYQKACDEVTSDKMDLENILKELRSWLEEMLDDEKDIFSVVRVKDVLSELNELEGDKNE